MHSHLYDLYLIARTYVRTLQEQVTFDREPLLSLAPCSGKPFRSFMSPNLEQVIFLLRLSPHM